MQGHHPQLCVNFSSLHGLGLLTVPLLRVSAFVLCVHLEPVTAVSCALDHACRTWSFGQVPEWEQLTLSKVFSMGKDGKWVDFISFHRPGKLRQPLGSQSSGQLAAHVGHGSFQPAFLDAHLFFIIAFGDSVKQPPSLLRALLETRVWLSTRALGHHEHNLDTVRKIVSHSDGQTGIKQKVMCVGGWFLEGSMKWTRPAQKHNYLRSQVVAALFCWPHGFL